MSNASIPQVYVDGFRDALRHLAQQEMTKLRPYVDEFSPEAETGHWDRLSAGDMATKARKSATPETGRTWSRRVAIATPYNDSEVTEVEDPSMMLIDPNSNIVQSMGYSAARQFDDIIIAAATGLATEVSRTAGEPSHATVAFPAGQTVGDGTLPISFDFITAVQELFMDNDIDPSMFKVAVVGPTQVRKLMQLTEQTSADYVNREALQTLNASGVVPNWMGFTWIMSTRLTIPAVDEIDCLFFTRRAIGLHVPEDITTFVQRDPSLQYAWRPYCQLTAGAVRVEDEHIVRGHFADTL
jgi:hypothetical protein